MKTIKVRPVLVESKENKAQNLPLYTIGKCIKQLSDVNVGKLQLIQRMMFSFEYFQPMELVLISLEDEKIEAGDLFLLGWSLYIAERCSSDETIYVKDNKGVFFQKMCKKVIARQSQISPEYISKFIEQYNRGGVEDLEIKMEEYFNQSIGDKVEVINNVYNFSKGDLITIKQFNYKNDCNLIEFEEDDEYKQGFHISHLNINSKFEPKLTNGFVTIVAKEPITYTEEEVKSLCSGAYSLGLSSLKSEIPDLEEMMELDNWFENNKKK